MGEGEPQAVDLNFIGVVVSFGRLRVFLSNLCPTYQPIIFLSQFKRYYLAVNCIITQEWFTGLEDRQTVKFTEVKIGRCIVVIIHRPCFY